LTVQVFEFWESDDGAEMLLVPHEIASSVVGRATREPYRRTMVVEAQSIELAATAVYRRKGWQRPP
jgi:hypothetical protein